MIKKFISYYRPHLKLFILDIICAIILSGIDLLFPIITNKVLKQYISDKNYQLLITVGILLLIAYIFRFFLQYIIGFYGHVMGARIERDMRKDLYHKFQEMDYAYFDNKKTGELLANLTSHLNEISEMSHHTPEDIIVSSIMLVGSFIILLSLNIYLTFIVYFFLILLIIFSVSRNKEFKRVFRRTRVIQSELTAEIESSLSGVRLTKAFNNEQFEENKFANFNNEYTKVRSDNFKQIGLFGSGNAFFISLTNLALLVFGGLFVIFEIGEVDLVDLNTYFLYINFMIKPIERLVNSIEQCQQGLSGVEKFYNIMIQEPSITSPDNPVIKDKFEGKISFKNVDFNYTDHEDEYVLKNFNLEIKPGQHIAIVGETGSGKTTISKLVPRFYDVNSGCVLVDDINVKDYDLNCLRKAIGHVQQDVVIFYGTIKENILYGNPQATMEQVIEAAKKARIDEFIMSLDQGYDTLVGEKGVKLSGGQKQRISIARLFLKNPSIIILDEATSALDNITEKMIQEAIDELSKNKTSIMIAHRLSTIMNCDEIVVISKEGIIERGTHQQLINNKGYYAKLYNATISI